MTTPGTSFGLALPVNSSFVLPYRAVAVWLADRPHELAVPARWPLRLSCRLMLDAHVFVEDKAAHVLHHYGLGTRATAGTVRISR